MKVLEQTVSPKKVRTEIVSFGNKKFIRISREVYGGLVLTESAEWRRHKTNHQVKREQNELLEEEYKKSFSTKKSAESGSFPVIKNNEDRKRIERGLVEASENGKALLSGVKYIKEQTGWGLKESKNFVDYFFNRKF